MPRFFRVRYKLGHPPQTPTQETFREKFLGISKAFAKIKWCSRCEVLWLTFLTRKVSQFFRFFDITNNTEARTIITAIAITIPLPTVNFPFVSSGVGTTALVLSELSTVTSVFGSSEDAVVTTVSVVFSSGGSIFPLPIETRSESARLERKERRYPSHVIGSLSSPLPHSEK